MGCFGSKPERPKQNVGQPGSYPYTSTPFIASKPVVEPMQERGPEPVPEPAAIRKESVIKPEENVSGPNESCSPENESSSENVGESSASEHEDDLKQSTSADESTEKSTGCLFVIYPYLIKIESHKMNLWPLLAEATLWYHMWLQPISVVHPNVNLVT